MKPDHTKLPAASGIYLFKDKAGRIIYIGKAKNIKKRVAHYFQNRETDWKIKSLIDEYETIDFIITKNEEEALLLEAQLVKEHQPKFNVLLKSGQPFVYLLFSEATKPELLLVRNKKQKGHYVGPFLNKKQARGLYEYLLNTFQLARCNLKIENGCLKYHLGLCAGNCRSDFDEKDYLFRLQLAQQLLKNEYKQAAKLLEERMHVLVKNLEFEKAKHVHDYVQNLSTIDAALKAKLSKYDKSVLDITMREKTVKVVDDSLSAALQQLLDTEKPIASVDCFDISHFQSNAIVGSCVRFVNGLPEKNKFRRFNIRSLKQQNDYAALQEIVARRYKNGDLPDLVVIDGGKGQLNAVRQLNLPVQLVSLAKREERLFADNFPEGYVLDVATPIGKFFIELRDYAHHFAINYHRFKRLKKTIKD